jgi:hypothetical protein
MGQWGEKSANCGAVLVAPHINSVWECLSYGDIPYGELKTIDVQTFLEEGERVEQPEGCPDDFHEFFAVDV